LLIKNNKGKIEGETKKDEKVMKSFEEKRRQELKELEI